MSRVTALNFEKCPCPVVPMMRRHARISGGVGAGENIRAVTLPNVLVGPLLRLNLLEQLTGAANGASTDAAGVIIPAIHRIPIPNVRQR